MTIVSRNDSLPWNIGHSNDQLLKALRTIDHQKGNAGIFALPGCKGEQLGFVAAAGNSAEEAKSLSHIYKGVPGEHAGYVGYAVASGIHHQTDLMLQIHKGEYRGIGYVKKSGQEHQVFGYDKGGHPKPVGFMRANHSVFAFVGGKPKCVGSAGSPTEAAALLLIFNKH